MTLAEVKARAPRSYEAWRLRNEEGLARGPIAARMGTTTETVDGQIKRVNRMLAGGEAPANDWAAVRALDAKLRANGRCKCGLLLPCVCVPSIYAVAALRPNAGT